MFFPITAVNGIFVEWTAKFRPGAVMDDSANDRHRFSLFTIKCKPGQTGSGTSHTVSRVLYGPTAPMLIS